MKWITDVLNESFTEIEFHHADFYCVLAGMHWHLAGALSKERIDFVIQFKVRESYYFAEASQIISSAFPYSGQHYLESNEVYFKQRPSLTATECGMLSKK